MIVIWYAGALAIALIGGVLAGRGWADRRAAREERITACKFNDEAFALVDGLKYIGNVCDAGGGHVQVYVTRDLDAYPTLGTKVFVHVEKDTWSEGDTIIGTVTGGEPGTYGKAATS